MMIKFLVSGSGYLPDWLMWILEFIADIASIFGA
jgi:hypothetical protein